VLQGLRNLFSSGPAPYADPKSPIPLGEVLRRDWFELWYQPKIELKTMHLVGAEALVRARHPIRGIVPPALFLPDASDDEMHALTERVIDKTCGQCAGIGARQAANPTDVARGPSASRKLAGNDAGSDRRPNHL
jgi:EAL domain-containing protein (putative c-di-GMP-specific phosphodiesterase class I)